MARPLFSDMLLNRRRQLGLSIKQASNVLRLKEEVLVAFEEGDFDSIPKSGYAQGMLSSYARYLGLNAKTVVNQFSQDLFEHERGSGSHEARRRSRLNRDADDGPLYEVPQAAAPRSRRTYVESHGFLPTAGGFAGDMGDFATTSAARPRYSSASRQDSYDDTSYDAYPQGRPYTSRVPLSQNTVTPLGQAQRQRPTSRRTASSLPGVYDVTRPSGAQDYRDEVTMRRVMPAQYRDDMRLDNEGRSYESASSAAGRRSSRNIANTQRPNVRRRDTRASRERLRDRERAQQGGVMGAIGTFFEDRGHVMLVAITLLCLVITLTLIFSVRSCMSSQQTPGRSVPVASAETETEKTETQSTMTSEEEERARADAAAAKAAESESDVTERTFEVTVADGEVTWIEIEYDGTSDVAETVTGPWNRTYTVRQAISINVNDTSAVTVTEGGKKLEFDSKASGIGTISIQVSKKGETATDDASATEGAQGGTEGTTDQQGATSEAPGQTDAAQQTGTDQMAQVNGTTAQDGTQQATPMPEGGYDGYTLDADGYYYGADGYYDANGNFYEYGG